MRYLKKVSVNLSTRNGLTFNQQTTSTCLYCLFLQGVPLVQP